MAMIYLDPKSIANEISKRHPQRVFGECVISNSASGGFARLHDTTALKGLPEGTPLTTTNDREYEDYFGFPISIVKWIPKPTE